MNNTISIDPTSLSLRQLHGYLLAAVAPRPIALVSSVNKQGQINLSPFSYFNVFSANPPVMIFSPARRGTDNTVKHTYENVNEVSEVVVNVVNHTIIEQVSLASSEYPREVNEFIKSGLTQVRSEQVIPPRVGESPVAFECIIDRVIPLGNQAGAGNLVIAKVVLIHVHEKYLDQDGELLTENLDLVGRMGGSWYVRATGDALFKLPKPGKTLGLGVDGLPDSIKRSEVLTGSSLARIASMDKFPTLEAISEWKKEPRINQCLKGSNARVKLHQLAQELIIKDQISAGFKTLMVADELE